MINVNTPQIAGLTPRQQNAAFNQNLAQAHAESDMRYNMKPLDRAGMSRGGEQRSLAGIASAQNLADGIAKAYSQRLQDQSNNANIGLGNMQSQEDVGLSVGQLSQQQAYANALAALQRQQQATGALDGLLGGMGSYLGY